MPVNITIRGTDRVIAEARRQHRNIRGFSRRSLHRSVEYIQDVTDELFDASEDYGLHFPGDRGIFWPDRKNEENYRHPKLVKTGRLRNSIEGNVRVDRRTSKGYYMRATVASTAPYARRHQEGDEANNVPARPFLFLTDEDELFISTWFRTDVDNLFA